MPFDGRQRAWEVLGPRAGSALQVKQKDEEENGFPEWLPSCTASAPASDVWPLTGGFNKGLEALGT